MTNQQWLATLYSKDCAEKIMWLVWVYSSQYNNSTLAIKEWLEMEHK